MNWMNRKKQGIGDRVQGTEQRPDLFSLFLNDGGKRDCGDRYRRLPAGRQEFLPSQLKLQSFFSFSGHVCFCADNQETSAQEQWRELLMEQTESALGVLLSFRMNENASQETYKAYNSQKNFGSDRKFFKKITGQAYCKDSGPDGVNAFRDKFSSGVVKNISHRMKVYCICASSSNSFLDKTLTIL